MYVVIIGGGEIGQAISADLDSSHNVTVIDSDRDIIEKLTYTYDILPIHGDGTEIATLREADIENADIVVACTDNNEYNIVACNTIKSLSDAFTIACVGRRSLLDTWEKTTESFGVDFMICPDLLTTQAIFRISGFPAAQNVDTFVGGRVQMAVFEIESGSPIANQTISETEQYNSLTFMAVISDSQLELASGDTILEPHDRVVVIGRPKPVREFGNDITSHIESSTNDIVIVGASEIGIQTAKVFGEHGYNTALLEYDSSRARSAAEYLPNTTVLEHDATDIEYLERKQIGEAKIFISAFENEEKNLLTSLLGDYIGARETVAVVETFQYSELFETVGVDTTVNPLVETAEEIIKFTRENHTEKIVAVEHDMAEVFEIKVTNDSIFSNREIQEAMKDLPDGVIIGAISRGGQFVTPRGSTVIEPTDHLVMFVEAEVHEEVISVI